MKEGITMHYPYNPGVSQPPFGYTSTSGGRSIGASRPVQNDVPVEPSTPMPDFPTPPTIPEPGSFGPLPGVTFPFGTSPGALTQPTQPGPSAPPAPPPAFPTPVQPPTPIPIVNEENPPAGTEAPLVRPVRFEGPETPFVSTGIPTVIPEPPHFLVPSNPLLPPEYEEILSYESLQYMNGFLRTQIGKECLVSMTVGTGGSVLSRLGYLIGVGLNYLLLQDACSEEILVCDFYSVRLVQILGKRCPPNILI